MVTLYVFRVPMWMQPDEGDHIAYTRHLIEKRAFPVFVGRKPGHSYEAHQPPLYYALCAPGYALAGSHRVDQHTLTAAYLCRIVSALCGLGIIVLIYWLAQSLFKSDPVMPAVAAGFAALLPMHLHVSASIGNDALAGLTCAATIVWIVQRWNVPTFQRFNVSEPVVAGVLTGLALWSKSSCLFLLPMIAVVYFMRGREQHNTPCAIRWAGAAVLTTLLVISPWWIRNTMLYGDPLVARAFLQGFDNPGPDFFLLKARLSPFDFAFYFFTTLTFMTFWGVLGRVNDALNRYTKAVFDADPNHERFTFYAFIGICLLFTLPALIGCFKGLRACSARFILLTTLAVIIATVGWFSALQAMVLETPSFATVAFALSALLVLAGWMTTAPPRSHVSTPDALLIVGIVLILIQFLQFNTHYFQAQARYLHPMLIGIAPCFVWGLDTLLPKPTRCVWIPLLAALLIALSAMSLTAWNAPTK
jgi:4-amino-4-deoxy-L-arabinose transferase-like glycosyltransferase